MVAELSYDCGLEAGVNMFTRMFVWLFATATLPLMQLIPVYVLHTDTHTVTGRNGLI